MIYIRNDSTDPYYNLAFEEYVFKNIRKNDTVLLLWQNEPSVIIGQHQNTVEEINSEYIYSNDIKVVRRITGGGAVYHDLGNLNYSFLIPDVKADIDFGTFTKPLISALRTLGVDAEQTGRNDITVAGKKISGNAQHYSNKILLHHGTILFDSQLDNVAKALSVKDCKIKSKGIKSVRSRVTNIRPYLASDMTMNEFKKYLLKSFSESEVLETCELNAGEQREVIKLSEEKYRTYDWNYGYVTECDIERKCFFQGGIVEARIKLEKGRISEIKIFGDYFGVCDTAEFEAALIGIKYNKEAVTKCLGEIDVSKYFNKITRQEIESLII